MSLARLLAAALLCCALPVLGQDHPRAGYALRDGYSLGLCFAPAATPEEPWRIVPNQPADLGSGQISLSQLSLGRPAVECRHYGSLTVKGHSIPGNWTPQSLVLCGKLPDADEACRTTLDVFGLDLVGPTCYTIRGYVVARDSEDSDSTHPVSYSTCQPAERFQLKTTEMRSVVGYR